MSTQPTNQSSIEQLHRDVAALAEEMRSPTATRATLLPFSIGAALALAIFVVVAIVVRLI
jgi:hypothetical protein